MRRIRIEGNENAIALLIVGLVAVCLWGKYILDNWDKP